MEVQFVNVYCIHFTVYFLALQYIAYISHQVVFPVIINSYEKQTCLFLTDIMPRGMAIDVQPLCHV